MVRFVHDGNGVMAIMLEGRVDDGVVGADVGSFVTPMEVNAITVEEKGENAPQEVEVDGHEEGDDKDRCCANELVHPFISNHRERTGVVKNVVVLVDIPEKPDFVPNLVIRKLSQIRSDPHDKKGKQMVLPRMAARSTESTVEVFCAEVEGNGWAERRNNNPLEHQRDLVANHLGTGELWVKFVSPFFICGILVILQENDSGHGQGKNSSSKCEDKPC